MHQIHRWAVPRYFFSTGTVDTLEKKYRYRSAGTFVSQFLGGTRYFCKIFCNKTNNNKMKSAQLHLYTFHSNRSKDLFLEYNAANPSMELSRRGVVFQTTISKCFKGNSKYNFFNNFVVSFLRHRLLIRQ